MRVPRGFIGGDPLATPSQGPRKTLGTLRQPIPDRGPISVIKTTVNSKKSDDVNVTGQIGIFNKTGQPFKLKKKIFFLS